jgi:hypothetical protein
MEELKEFFPRNANGEKYRQQLHSQGRVGRKTSNTCIPRRGSDESTGSNESSSSTSSTASAASMRLRELLSDSCYNSSTVKKVKSGGSVDSQKMLGELVDCYIMLNLELTRDFE